MVNTFYFLRHAQTTVDLSRPSKEWVLSEIGIKQCRELASSNIFSKIDVIICSTEKKTSLTAQPFAELVNKPIFTHTGLNEIGSDKLPLQNTQEFEKLRLKCFKNLDYAEYGWESSRNALKRLKSAIGEINTQYTDKTILIVSHGTILSLYFADLLGIINRGTEVFKRWKQLGFCVWGLVINNKVIRDINQIS
ncbi:MAG: histidine phosphatase family protein [Candidatus Hermodarchaeota archaeon]